MLLEAKQLCFRYGEKAPELLGNLSLSVGEGERLGLTAPSGYGKTTLVKLLAGYERPTGGTVLLDGSPLLGEDRPLRRTPFPTKPSHGAAQRTPSPVQLICQHPENSVNPRWKMRKVLSEAGPLRPELLAALGIEEEWLNRYPQALSGGELQRFCIARALTDTTKILIADEISTMLDVITQAQLWAVLLKEAEERKLGMVVVTHNPALAKRVCTRVVDLPHINFAP